MRVFSGLPGGWTGKARQRTAAAPVSAEVLQATRALSELPAGDQRQGAEILVAERPITASPAGSSCFGGAGDFRPATL